LGNDLALRVYTSRLLGQEPALVLHGGGNTSVKSTAREITGDPVQVLFVKGSGCDLSTIEPEGFSACRLEGMRRLAELSSLSDDQAVRAFRAQMLDPTGPTPSVEALLHAWLPAKFVDHTHADAVLAVLDQPDSERRVREVWGTTHCSCPTASRLRAGQAHRRARQRVRSRATDGAHKHGIFSWGQTAQRLRAHDRRRHAGRAASKKRVARGGRGGAGSRRTNARGGRPRCRPSCASALARRLEGARWILEWQRIRRSRPLSRDDAGRRALAPHARPRDPHKPLPPGWSANLGKT
jgi:rhamnose utilization protein RhaD (predicted bifunctional aldolase and dehydrogenase)